MAAEAGWFEEAAPDGCAEVPARLPAAVAAGWLAAAEAGCAGAPAGFWEKLDFNPETMLREPAGEVRWRASAEMVVRSLTCAGALAVVREVLAEAEDDLLAGGFERELAVLRVLLAELLDRVEVAVANRVSS